MRSPVAVVEERIGDRTFTSQIGPVSQTGELNIIITAPDRLGNAKKLGLIVIEVSTRTG